MRIRTLFITLLAALPILLTPTIMGKGIDISANKAINISSREKPILNAWSFGVTDDELFLIPDFNEGNIKIYEKNGQSLQQVDILGRKGYAPDELVKPSYCFFNEDQTKFAVLDLGKRKIIIYDRHGRLDFRKNREVPCQQGGSDFKLIGDKLFVSGYTTDEKGRHFDFYSISLKKGKKDFMMPSFRKYGFDPSKDFGQQYAEQGIPIIGFNGWFDIEVDENGTYKDEAYFAWEGSLELVKINTRNREINPRPLGYQPSHYVKPFLDKRLRDARKTMSVNLINKAKESMSYVRRVFTAYNYIMMIYEGPFKNARVQFFNTDGTFITEKPVPGPIDKRLFFDKKQNILYSLAGEWKGDGEGHVIYSYKISFPGEGS